MRSNLPSGALLDSNILLRTSHLDDPLCQEATDVLDRLESGGIRLSICPQVLQELRQVATRPVNANGLGWTSQYVATLLTRLEGRFHLVKENAGVYPAWRTLVEAVGSIGRANFDARIVAVAQVAGIDAVLTYEAAAFAKYGAQTGVQILDPRSL